MKKNQIKKVPKVTVEMINGIMVVIEWENVEIKILGAYDVKNKKVLLKH